MFDKSKMLEKGIQNCMKKAKGNEKGMQVVM